MLGYDHTRHVVRVTTWRDVTVEFRIWLYADIGYIGIFHSRLCYSMWTEAHLSYTSIHTHAEARGVARSKNVGWLTHGESRARAYNRGGGSEGEAPMKLKTIQLLHAQRKQLIRLFLRFFCKLHDRTLCILQKPTRFARDNLWYKLGTWTCPPQFTNGDAPGRGGRKKFNLG